MIKLSNLIVDFEIKLSSKVIKRHKIEFDLH